MEAAGLSGLFTVLFGAIMVWIIVSMRHLQVPRWQIFLATFVVACPVWFAIALFLLPTAEFFGVEVTPAGYALWGPYFLYGLLIILVCPFIAIGLHEPET